MRFFDYIRIAFKNISRQKTRTFLTIVAIMIGSISIILMASLLTTIRNSIYAFFDEMDAFTMVTVTPDPNSADSGGGLIKSDAGGDKEGKIIDDTTLATLKTLPNVSDATPIGGNIWMKNMRLDGQTKKMWANTVAFDPETKVFNTPLMFGRSLARTDMDKIIVGSRFVKTYGFENNPEALLGKKVMFLFDGMNYPDWGGFTPPKPPEGDNKEWWEEQQKKSLEIPVEIVGIAKSSTFDDSQNFINIAWAKKLMTHVRWEWSSNCSKEEMDQKNNFYKPCESKQELVKNDDFSTNGYASIILKTNDRSTIAGVAAEVGKMGYGVSTAQDMIDEINKMLLAIGTGLGIIGGISLFVAAIGIINTMVMATYERTREIGVMRACGATKKTIRKLFTFEAALLGFLGGTFGLFASMIIGNLANWFVTNYVSDINLPFDQIASFPWWLICGVLIFTTVIGLISGLAPAIRASKMDPVDALRYE